MCTLTRKRTDGYTHTYVCTYTPTHVYTQLQLHTHTCTQIMRIHTYIHTHTVACVHSRRTRGISFCKILKTSQQPNLSVKISTGLCWKSWRGQCLVLLHTAAPFLNVLHIPVFVPVGWSISLVSSCPHHNHCIRQHFLKINIASVSKVFHLDSCCQGLVTTIDNIPSLLRRRKSITLGLYYPCSSPLPCPGADQTDKDQGEVSDQASQRSAGGSRQAGSVSTGECPLVAVLQHRYS